MLLIEDWKRAPRCHRCRKMLSDKEDVKYEGLCRQCFAEHPPCLVCGGRRVVFRPARDSRGVVIKQLVGCPLCA